ncbi:uncharacterized protein LOC494404 [Ciona intestinalis]
MYKTEKNESDDETNTVLVLCVLLLALQLADCWSWGRRRHRRRTRRRQIVYVGRPGRLTSGRQRFYVGVRYKIPFTDTAENENNPIETESDETPYINSDQADDELMQMAEE